MVHIFRKHQQTILIVITIVVIFTFIWFWNGPAGRAGAGGPAGTGGEKWGSIYGREIYVSDVQRDMNKLRIAQALGLDALVRTLAGDVQQNKDAGDDFVFNSYVLDHEAEALEVTPTDQEVQDEESRVPAFQTDGQFDPQKLSEVVQGSMLPSLGFTSAIIDELVKEQVKIKKLAGLIGATVDVSPAETRNRFLEANEKMDLVLVRLRMSDVEQAIPVSDADAKKTYDVQKDQYQSAQQRKVTVAAFELSAADQEKKGKDRTDALQNMGNEAEAFTEAIADNKGDFAALAKQNGAKLSVSGYFTAAQPDPALENMPDLASKAFALSSENPNSDVVQGENGYYVLHLMGTVPSQPLTFDQAKPEIIAQIKHQRAAQIMQTRATQARTIILAALKAGKSFDDAAKMVGLTAETLPPFSLMEASKVDEPDMQAILENAISLSDGQFSDFVETSDGGMYVYLIKREPLSDEEVAQGAAMMREDFLKQKRMGAFLEWLRLRRQAARAEMARTSA